MNDARRKRLAAASQLISDAKAILEEVRDEEQEAFDAMPESFQNGEKGEKSQEAIDSLDEAASSCEQIDDNIATAKGDA